MSIKTLHLTYLYNEQSGGVATFYRAMMRRASESGRQMVLVVPGDRWSVEQVSDTVRLYRVAAGHSIVGDRRYRVLLPHHFLFPGETRFKKILEREQPDVVEACDKYSLFYLLGYLRLGWAGNMQLPTTIATTMERMDDNFLTYFGSSAAGRQFTRWYMHNIFYRIPKCHIAISRYVASELDEAPTAKALDKVRILPLGVDSATFHPPGDLAGARLELRTELGLAADAKVLVYAGRLSLEKNIALLTSTLRILLLRQNRDFHLALIGGGMLRSELEELARSEFRGHLHLMKHVDGRKRLAALLGGADVFVHPNPREPFGIGPLEAMGCGVPVVLPDRGGVLEYANQENSWLSQPDPESFAGSVLRAMEGNPDTLGRVLAARQTAEQHDWNHVTDQFFQLYETLHLRALQNPDPWPVPFYPRWWPWRKRSSPSTAALDPPATDRAA